MRSTRPHAAPLQETFEVGAFRTAWMPGQARARRAVVVCDLRFTAGLAEPDSRGLVLGIHAQKPSPGEARRIWLIAVKNGEFPGSGLKIELQVGLL
jgi:hypothetical protein